MNLHKILNLWLSRVLPAELISEMTVRKRPQLWCREVPGGWRVVSIRQGTSINPFYFSPEGKRFASLAAVKVHVANKQNVLSDTEDNTEHDDDKKKKKKRRKRKISEVTPEEENKERTAKKLKFEDDKDEDTKKVSLKLPEEILKRRKLMAARSPFRNLLKRTLVRNHIRMKGRMASMIPGTNNKRPADDDEADDDNDSDEEDPPPAKKQKLVEEASTEEEANGKVKDGETDQSQMTPPRKSTRPSMMFTPPNLTPPVLRRNTNLTFSSPSQRNVTARIAKPLNKVLSPLK